MNEENDDIQESEGTDFVKIEAETRRKPGRPIGSKGKNWEYVKKQREQANARKKLWAKGILSWKLDSSQMDLYRDYKSPKIKEHYWCLSRQTGKSWTVCTVASEDAIQKPGIRMAYIAPQLSDAFDITEQTFDQIYEDNQELKPKYNSKLNRWEWANGSYLKIAGTDNKNYNKIRGRKFDRIFLDEFCFMDDFRKVLFSCVYPTTTSVPDYKVIFISTPPETPDHESNMILDDAEERGVLIAKTIYDCPRFSPEYIEENIVKRYRPLGGTKSVDFRREYMVERIPDINKLVLPEVNQELIQKIVADVQRPEFFKINEAFDWGVLDNNAGLFAYIDYEKQVIVIEDELFENGVHFTTKDIAGMIREKEMKLWGHNGHIIQRCCDNNLQIINDMCSLYHLTMFATQKHEKSAAIQQVRQLLANGQIIINPRCVNLIEQIQSATWVNSKKKDFARRNGHHYDLVASLIYLIRNANLQINPFPVDYSTRGLKRDDYLILNKKSPLSADLEALKKMFTIKKKK